MAIEYNHIVKYIRHHVGPCAVAVSGGVDSTLLLRAAADALGKNLLAITVVTPYTISRDHTTLRVLFDTLEVPYKIFKLPLLDAIRNNPENRCYTCKYAIMSAMKKIAVEEGFGVLIEGTNADDVFLHRPGMKALQELGVRSPLLECSASKQDVRRLLHMFDPTAAERQSNSCLLTRLPHGTEINIDDLKQIEAAEDFLLDLGFRFVRVRKEGHAARIEIDPESRENLSDTDFYTCLSSKMKEFGFNNIFIDESNHRSH